jgi:hypothetical protein
MKKSTQNLVLLSLGALLALASCGQKASSSSSSSSISLSREASSETSSIASSSLLSPSDQTLYEDEMAKSFAFFWDYVSANASSPAYGLVADRARGNIASTASTGFGLAALPIGVERGYVTKEAASARALITLQNVNKLTNLHGFYWHFIMMDDGTRSGTSEISIIDTAILVFGGLLAGAYFGNEVETEAVKLYSSVDWKWFLGTHNGKSQFRMAYNPDTSSFAGYWDYYAEQLMLYILGAGAPNADYRTDLTAYNGFTRATGSYGKGKDFIYSWFGSLFTYQYSLAFIDFRNLKDPNGVSWWQNSMDASTAAYQWCVDKKADYATYSEGSWGLTACDTKWGYNGYLGNKPRGWTSDSSYESNAACTIAPCGALGSMPFTPELSLQALRNYAMVDGLSGKYGYFDAYDLVHGWTATSYIGIDKGITLLMMDNYLHGTAWSLSKKVTYVQDGLSRLGFTEVTNNG